MTLIQHEESRRLRRFLFWSVFIFVIGAHLVRAMSHAGSIHGGAGLSEFFSGNFWGSFDTYAIRPLNEFRLGLGDLFSGVAKACPNSTTGACDKAVGVIRMILGLHP